MTRKEFYRGIDMDDKSQKYVECYEMDQETYQKSKVLFFDNIEKFIKQIFEGENPEGKLLYLYVNFAIEVFKEFEKDGIELPIYFDTMRDIALWSNVGLKKLGIPGLLEAEWVSRSIKRRLYRLGRLQFEPIELTEEIQFEGTTYTKGTKVLNIHIPEDGKLEEKDVKEAIAKAAAFFGKEYQLGICISWLLAPQLLEILNEESNIIKFQKCFKNYGMDYALRQAEQRVFGKLTDDIEQYPEETGLQKNLKAYLRKHPSERIGMGKGLLRMIEK